MAHVAVGGCMQCGKPLLPLSHSPCMSCVLYTRVGSKEHQTSSKAWMAVGNCGWSPSIDWISGIDKFIRALSFGQYDVFHALGISTSNTAKFSLTVTLVYIL